VRLSPEELGPARSGPSWGRTEARGPEQGADRRRPDPDPELAELAFDPDAAPTGVLPGQLEDELTDRGIDRWPAWAAGPAVGPLPRHELAVPPEEGRRGHEEGDPAVTRDDPTRRREQDPVDGPELRSARRPLQHPELMAEDEDLEVLGSVGATTLATADEETDEGADNEVEERPHRPIVPGRSQRESAFLTSTGIHGLFAQLRGTRQGAVASARTRRPAPHWMAINQTSNDSASRRERLQAATVKTSGCPADSDLSR